MQSIGTFCPICNNDASELFVSTQDFSLTQAPFDIVICTKCKFHFTNPIPSKELIAPYYNFPSYISHTDVKEGWFNKIYHRVRQHTLLQKTIWIQSLFTGHKGNLLEIGAGTGAFAHAMVQKGWNVTALEPDEASRNRAFENYKIQLLPAESLYNLQNEKFEVITLWHVLEHVHDINDYMHAFKKLLKPNGRLIIAVPNYTSFDARFYKQYWAAYDVPRHLYHFSLASMQLLCKKNNMQVVSIKPMWFDSFYVSLLSEQYKKSGIIGVVRAFIIGSISNLLALKSNKKASSVVYEIKKLD
jgi:2-polyprenyl-3-methyl-5-hydroxy-6-metoxy-1,4-benzoquinol methylase